MIHLGRALAHAGPRGASQVRRLVPMVVQEMRLVDAWWEEIERDVCEAVLTRLAEARLTACEGTLHVGARRRLTQI